MDLADVIQMVSDYAPSAKLEHRQYIEGTLYLTQEQLEAIVASTSPYTSTCGSTYTALGGIPVRVLEPHVPVQLPSGKVVVHSLLLASLVVAHADVAHMFSPRRVDPELCLRCRRPPPAEWCWEQSLTCPLGRPPRGTNR
ncbi:Uncharacterised protein [Mycobacteroides abscessus subsp. massiliense]|uniref:hypothetical protein n=1 Tax=Mycobacteroides abscessus TaxID=36809 RepID=UPI0009A6DDB9|nr:hypothetical protein [Mycobacteroides abscessus]SKM81480.1 Uncharacterised protein [Mycobacteroides abscessus subsp. massiliense]SKM98107.1 Uncharacterised protein [Mycobacteroides abscessus subsp. massiliense]SKN76832.1 Uncharacterised protein [Mycobacteroides abscessus subsp. massiliense]SKN96290.1 Uncharacterised protein [Mycobacteroides abscessus subsp. massiliense]SKO21656.1 Uncharacterised protein [Mycobacteroides abscessus subsp. massiliense]